MAQEQEPAKKVAKRVVRKTVVKRPSTSRPSPRIRYGRLVAPTEPVRDAPTTVEPAAKASAPRKVTAPRPPAAPWELGKKAGEKTGKVAGAVGTSIVAAAHKVGDTTHAGWSRIRSFHIPRLEQTRAAAVVGGIIGLITVVITGGLTRMFSELRGVSTGGGKWGSLTVVVVAFIAFALGEYLLAKMHVRQPRITSFLALVLTLVLIMALFLGPIYTAWSWLIVPVLGAVTFAISHRLIAITDSSPREI